MELEADAIAGLELIAQQEVAKRLHVNARIAHPGVLRFAYGNPKPLVQLKTVLSVYSIQHFSAPRPKALQGDQHLRALLAQIDIVRGMHPPGVFRAFMLGAAGRDSAVMQRLKAQIAQHTGLEEVSEEGDLLVRLRPTPPLPSPSGREIGGKWPSKGPEGGWDALVRLSPKPLATRDWRVCNIEGSLQATVAHAMALLTQPRPDDTYLNLCCGSGTLLIERALAGPAQQLIGCDINPDALICASRNIAALSRTTPDRVGGRIKLHDWDATRLPLPDACADVIVADLPFGHRVGSHDDNRALYPAILREAGRVAKPGARCVLITAEVKLMEATLTTWPLRGPLTLSQWERGQSLRVNLGGLRPAIFVLRRV